jgi:hypothetical protein
MIFQKEIMVSNLVNSLKETDTKMSIETMVGLMLVISL